MDGVLPRSCEPQNIQFRNLLRSAVPISKENSASMLFEEDVVCDSAKDPFVLSRESETKGIPEIKHMMLPRWEVLKCGKNTITTKECNS